MNDDIQKMMDQRKAAIEEERGADKWEPKAGDMITGYVMKTGWYTGGAYRPSLYLLLKTDDGEDVRVYCKTVLLNQVREECPAIGSGVAIRYEGRETSQAGRNYDNYTFMLIPDDNGVVKRDEAYWAKAGVEPAKKVREQKDVDEDDLF